MGKNQGNNKRTHLKKWKNRPIRQLPKKMLTRLFHLKTGTLSRKHMNSIDYYLTTNLDLRNYILRIFDDVDSIKDLELRSVLNEIKLHGSDMEKI